MSAAPAPAPCRCCPYRRDVPSGVWGASEYEKLPLYDGETLEQRATGVFYCHQQDGRVCAGWAGTHDMAESLALRLAAASGRLSPREVDALLDYTTPVPLFASGHEVAAHGLREIAAPGPGARRTIDRVSRRQKRGCSR